jgi:anthranilate phosphoribosyltransferase
MIKTMNTLLEGKSLSREQAQDAMSKVIEGLVTPEQVGAFLIALRIKQESVEEISGFLDCLRKRAVKVPISSKDLEDLMDVCGTGGDASGTFNVSTTVAFVVAAAGQPIAKHGNRSVSSRSGSFDVLEELGLTYTSDPEKVSHSIRDFGIGLFFAPAFHPSLKTLAALRKNLGVYTIFNALGPLLNPAGVKRQLIGVYSPLLLEKMANVLSQSGAEEAMIVRGEDGMDEISLSSPTQVSHLKAGKVRNYTLTPEEVGLKSAPAESLKGGSARENAQILLQILRSEAGPKRDIVLFNAAAALMVGGKASDLKEGVARAREAIDSGKALALLKRMGANV